uniref:Uncharacterized protein n=1 Tax=Faecalibaculum rodentium TaxID=1702221 RepID=A0A140DXV8_9FIRM|nr:hypothetical protein AALO17_23510 [Faecalibaculum rodentium]
MAASFLFVYQLDYSARHAPAKRQFGQTVTIGRGLFVTGDPGLS